MSHKDVYSTVNALVPCTHIAWDEGEAPSLPFAAYLAEEIGGLAADNGCIDREYDWRVELYEKARDSALEDNLHDALAEKFKTKITRRYVWIESQRLIEVAYTFRQIERK